MSSGATLGLGVAALSAGDGQPEATAAVAAALEAGVRYFDAAPYYGLGQGELALGGALRELGSDGLTLSTKVGRTVAPGTQEWHFDYSRDAVLRSLDASLGRLGVAAVDIVYVHDPDRHERDALDGALPALLGLRDQGVIGAVGAGMNQWQMPLRFIRDLDLDVLLIAGRYSLLDASAADELFPECLERGVDVVLGGVYNSGVLANPRDGASFDYRPASEEHLARARAIQAVARRHGVELRDAALAFSRAHPAVTSVLLGASGAQQVRDNTASWSTDVPGSLWEELPELGLLPEGAVIPQ
ncbi:aldo/keto reductase [soil metagenome]